ncbi:mandelate racemase/muconate lactonizing enzyme family protein [Litchfieldia alkalitelluris]|uniref:mandelate racemase/muconate lactonizing enzyme family protein n=1 Tax=Litchfieldia alkalitelluris TaxID=304268 RepID=UPI001F48464A|nr:dipeptide epimerase [Litchfieldia alkalitelluris]
MEIQKVDIYGIRLPLKEPFIISYDTFDHMPIIVTRLETDEGIVGWGESLPDPHVTGETWESTYQVIRNELAPLVLGENPFSIDYIHKKMNERIYAAPSAKAAIDIALYDLMGKITGQPLYQLLGGKAHPELVTPQVISMKSPEAMAKDGAAFVKAGYRNIKIKVGSGGGPSLDINRIRAVREAISEETKLRVDANQGWDLFTAITVINETKDCQVEWYEQPVIAHDLKSIAEIRRTTHAKIMVDESVHNSQDLLNVIEHRAADLLNIKLMKAGGIYPALALASIAEAAGMSCQIGSMVESAIGTLAGAHLSIAKTIIKSNEMIGPKMFTKDVGEVVYHGDVLKLPDKPGLGVDVDEYFIKENQIFQCSLSI